MKYHAFLIQNLTNMHVGSGDANYGMIDKLVQRDPVTGYPTINSSGVKGAIREFFKKEYEKKYGEKNTRITEIFGSDPKADKKNMKPGKCNFLGADLVAIPVRSNFMQYALAFNNTNNQALNKKAEMLTNQTPLLKPINQTNTLYFQVNQPTYDLYLEDVKMEHKQNFFDINPNIKKVVENRFASLTDDDFNKVTKNLPVIARNHLESGKSENLWYEEVIPHQSLFLTFIGYPEGNDPVVQEFINDLTENNIQIGANASIGYGICKFYQL